MIIRKANIADVPAIMQFIKEHWNENHILARDREFFEWMYVDEEGCNFIVAVDDENKIYGIEGVIKYNSSTCPDISGTVWKTLKTDNPCLGLEIGEKMHEIYQPRGNMSLGLNKKAMKINLLLGCLGGKMSHYYILGNCDDYKVAIVNQKQERVSQIKKKKFVPITSEEMLRSLIDDEIQKKKMPYKDADYIVHRYWKHPIYQYDILGIKDENDDVRSMIVGRSISCNKTKVYRFVDFIGVYEDLRETASCFYQIVDDGNYEYMDLYCVGVPEEIIKSMGFVERIQEEVIVPNYFSPFERKNIDMYFVSSQSEGLVIFRGDGDQDRPN